MPEQWFYKQDGQKYGPLSSQELKRRAENGEIHPEDLIRKASKTGWVKAKNCRGLLPDAKADRPEQSSTRTSDTNESAEPEKRSAVRKAKLFLSYGRRDATALAEKLETGLIASGYEVWRDVRDIQSGTDFLRVIENGLKDANLAVCLLSPHSVRRASDRASPDSLDSVCLDELSYARFGCQIPIVPVMAVPCEPPFVIYRLDYTDLCGWEASGDKYAQGLARILQAIESALRTNESPLRGWDSQLKPIDFSGFIDEKRKDFCGREWLFDEIDAWRALPNERALLIKGDPGIGKSAIVAELVHQNRGGQVLAYHCCRYDRRDTLQPARFVQSLAAMIASRIPEYESRLGDQEIAEALSTSRCEEDPLGAFEDGILEPLNTLEPPQEGIRYILVDALDEALLRDGAAGLTIVDLLAYRLDRLPPWLRVVATTRRERPVLQKLGGLRAKELDAHDVRNVTDVQEFIRQRLATPNLAKRLVTAQASVEEVSDALTPPGATGLPVSSRVHLVQSPVAPERPILLPGMITTSLK